MKCQHKKYSPIYFCFSGKTQFDLGLPTFLDQHNACIKHIDFSMDGSYLQSNDSSELYFFETESNIGSNTRVHMHGDAPEPCPLPSILQRVVEKYVLSDIP